MSDGDQDGAGQIAAPGFEAVEAAFRRMVNRQAGTGAALCVRYEGDVVIDVWGGYADEVRTRPWARDTIAMAYSVSKPLVAVCALKLVDEGRLGLDEPMQRYWPELRAAATVRQVLSHQAGVVALGRPVPTEVFFDWDAMCGLLAEQEPTWAPGSAHGESALFFGHLVGELVRRVDGRSVGLFLREEICDPNGIDFAFGLTAVEQLRVADITGLENIRGPQANPDRPALYELAISNPPGSRHPGTVNSTAWRSAEIPAINGHGSARGLAGFYQALLDGRILSSDLLCEATSVQCRGIDRVFGWENAWGLGFGVDPDGFGMGGLGGSYAGVSVAGGFVIAFVTATMGTHERVDHLDNVLRGCLGLPPLVQR
jgi:CubicO group peptidase (beta-lactamase class C family)